HFRRIIQLREPQPFDKHASDLGNGRAALQWSFSSSSAPVVGVALASAVAPALLELSLLSECHHWSRQALAAITAADVGTSTELARQEAWAFAAMSTGGNLDDVRSAITRGLALARALGDEEHELRLLAGMNIFLTRIGDFVGSVDVAVKPLAVARRLARPA